MERILLDRLQTNSGELITFRSVKKSEELPKLLLIHGNLTSSVHYEKLMRGLQNRYQMIALDLPGFGDSSYHGEYNSLFDFAKTVAEFIELIGWDKFEVLGWSTGGGIALELAYLLPDKVTQVFLLSSVGLKGYPIFKKNENMMPILTERLLTREEIASDPVQVIPILNILSNKDKATMKWVWDNSIYTKTQPDENEYNVYLEEIVKQVNLIDIDYALVHFNVTNEFNGVNEGSNHLADIKQPIQILHGENDLVVPVQEAKNTKDYLGEQATLTVFPEAGHSLLQDAFDDLIKILNNLGGIE